jgi:hypothetical protein
MLLKRLIQLGNFTAAMKYLLCMLCENRTALEKKRQPPGIYADFGYALISLWPSLHAGAYLFHGVI